MTTKGEELLQSIKGMRSFLGDLSQLLVAGETLLAERSWEPIGDNTCLFGLSYSLYQGHQWMPRLAYRRYANKADFPRVVAMISLLLDDHGFDYVKLTEPVVSGSYFVFPEDTPDKRVSLENWNALWFGRRSPPSDGTPITLDNTDPDWKQAWGWRYMQVFGRPLIEITNQTCLQQLIIDPLLKLIREHSKKAAHP